jgi:transposase InsO family protein
METRVRIMRELTRRGPVFIVGKLGLQASTVGRVLHRHHMPLLRELDPVTGAVIRATRRSAARYEHDHPGSLIHVDVKKLGRIPDGGGWRLHGRGERPNRKQGLGYDYVHTVIDDHSRLAYAEIHGDEKGTTAAGVLERAIEFYNAVGIRVERVISDNAFAYRHSTAFRTVINTHGIRQQFIKPHCPWTNGKVERLNRTLATEWAYAHPWTSNTERAAALPAWLDYYNLDRAHLGIAGQAPIDRINNGRSQYT